MRLLIILKYLNLEAGRGAEEAGSGVEVGWQRVFILRNIYDRRRRSMLEISEICINIGWYDTIIVDVSVIYISVRK